MKHKYEYITHMRLTKNLKTKHFIIVIIITIDTLKET